eukprot:4513987-Heterocapsa_arctica.AAC.1
MLVDAIEGEYAIDAVLKGKGKGKYKGKGKTKTSTSTLSTSTSPARPTATDGWWMRPCFHCGGKHMD